MFIILERGFQGTNDCVMKWVFPYIVKRNYSWYLILRGSPTTYISLPRGLKHLIYTLKCRIRGKRSNGSTMFVDIG